MRKKIGVGFLVVVFLGLFDPTLGQVFLLSIFCTAGIALVVWIPLLWLIGAVVLKVLNVIRSEKNGAVGASEPKASVSQEQVAIERYVDRAQFYGLSRDKILSELRNGGWSDAEIQAAYGAGITRA